MHKPYNESKTNFSIFINHHPFPNFYSQQKNYNTLGIKLGIFYTIIKKIFLELIKILLCFVLCTLAVIK